LPNGAAKKLAISLTADRAAAMFNNGRGIRDLAVARRRQSSRNPLDFMGQMLYYPLLNSA